MDHPRVPVLEAPREFLRRGDVGFGPPGHTQGGGADPRVAEILGIDVFRSDMLGLNGLDDRRRSQGAPEQAVLPRDAFFGPAEQVPAEKAVGRIAAGTISPCPPGVPVEAPGEVITPEVLDRLRSGLAHGFLISYAADPTPETVRVTARP
ncbi:hypothetical protein D9753_02195 [Streptomyces dangxiongensis]|uniref:Orn/Lys/Arg decarboxylase C-terminal domain-containing protein n=1 Tax=Streptomyces dangxiongensis TaxID=1442032 RepID=A0A3G2JBR7_9ACTN|nr:hypothetical protein [Streptomyces dangxiongensis]AYN37962.1 hypothetical protein D9753_02195 [Streptomyces dangxiongensis]